MGKAERQAIESSLCSAMLCARTQACTLYAVRHGRRGRAVCAHFSLRVLSTAEKCTAWGHGEWLTRPMKGAKQGQVSCLDGCIWTCKDAQHARACLDLEGRVTCRRRCQARPVQSCQSTGPALGRGGARRVAASQANPAGSEAQLCTTWNKPSALSLHLAATSAAERGVKSCQGGSTLVLLVCVLDAGLGLCP